MLSTIVDYNHRHIIIYIYICIIYHMYNMYHIVIEICMFVYYMYYNN